MAETLFELEHAYDRADLAAVFREFADALEAGTTVELHTADTLLSVDVPPRVVAELEAEREDGEPPVTELEFELEWDDPDGTSVRVRDAEPTGDAGTDDSTGERTESVADPATASIPPEAIAKGAAGTPEASREDGRRSRFEVYRDRADEWRWRLVHWNGNIIADSGEGYSSQSNAERAARGVMRNAPTARIERRDV
ncbi:amphi-Trp domain-containing protein [Natronococcus wangiae]|uniref:amphi-Trp domain-containing protein n=1 Tax=Natronococcus wangiae TaxID=3068275 RepID=UPI00273DD6B9|nr:amphi-Trp domain-containing protein [Natronococcus sp. AD5]